MCWVGQHKFYSYWIVIPILTLFGFFLPFYIIYKIYKYQNIKDSLERKKFLNRFEKFISPYKYSRASYGVLLIFNKIIVVFLKELVIQMTINGEMIVILLILLFYLVIYHLIHRFAKPYKTDRFEILELIEGRLIILQISNTLMAAIWISTLEERNKYVGWLIFLFVLLSNLVFLVWWFHNYFGQLKKKIMRISVFLENRFSLKNKNKSIQISRKTETLKKKREKETKDSLLDKLSKLKLLNSLLIERIKELELDSPHENSIAREGLLEQPPISNDETNLKRIIPNDIRFENKASSLSAESMSSNFQSSLKLKKNITFGKDSLIPIYSTARLNSPIGQIEKNLIINDKFRRKSNQEVGNDLKFFERSLVGRSFYKNFLLLKYKVSNENFTILKNSLILSKKIYKLN
jgi:hypothetical protein